MEEVVCAMIPLKHSLSSSAGASSAEVFEVLAKGNQFRLEKITSFAHASAEGQWYDQEEDEWVALLKGSASLQFEAGSLQLTAMEYLVIPARLKHRVAEVSTDAVWLALHSS